MTTHFGRFLHAWHDLGIAVSFRGSKSPVQPQTRIWVSVQQPSALQKDGRSDSTTPSIHIPSILQWASAASNGSLHKSWLLLPSLSSRTFTSSVYALAWNHCLTAIKSSLARVDSYFSSLHCCFRRHLLSLADIILFWQYFFNFSPYHTVNSVYLGSN